MRLSLGAKPLSAAHVAGQREAGGCIEVGDVLGGLVILRNSVSDGRTLAAAGVERPDRLELIVLGGYVVGV